MIMTEIQAQHGRLIILRALAGEPGQSLNSSLLQDELAAFAISRTREWVDAQIAFLSEAQAIEVTEAGSVKICRLRQRGLDHVERRITIDGVKRPALEA